MVKHVYTKMQPIHTELLKTSIASRLDGMYVKGEKKTDLIVMNKAMAIHIVDCDLGVDTESWSEWDSQWDRVWEQKDSVLYPHIFSNFKRIYDFGMSVKYLNTSTGTPFKADRGVSTLVNIRGKGNHIDLFHKTPGEAKIKTTLNPPSYLIGTYPDSAFCIDIRYLMILYKAVRKVSQDQSIPYDIESASLSLKSGSIIFHFGPHRACIMLIKLPKDPEVKRPKA